MSGTLSSQRRDLLEAAAAGDVQAIDLICDLHSAALFSLARAILGDSVQAEAVVIDVVARACADPGATAASAQGGLRRELARLIYLCAMRSLADPRRALLVPRSAVARMAELIELARDQRAAVALVQCGDHSVDDVADLLGLSVPAVGVLLCSGVRDLEIADMSRSYRATAHVGMAGCRNRWQRAPVAGDVRGVRSR